MANQPQTKKNQLREAIDLLNTDYLLGLNRLEDTLNSSDIYSYLKLLEKKGKLNFINQFEDELKKEKSSNGSRILKKAKYKIGMIADEFLYNSFKDTADVTFISSDANIEKMHFDFVIVATTWRGIDESWQGVASPKSRMRAHLMLMLDELIERQIPLVFYSKEDPVNFHLFKDIATKCDYIYTTAEEMVQDYIEYTNNTNVGVLQFGVNPHYHNPIGTRTEQAIKNKDGVIFAGSWTKKYPQRNKDLARIFDGLSSSGNDLTIFDRNLHLERERYLFPSKYIPYLTGPLNHDALMKVHKIFRWALNVNSVKYSETMFANRVFELQAFGNLIISNYSVGVNNQFPNVFMVNDESDVGPILNRHTESELREFQAKNIRNVMLENTTYHRINEIANFIGLTSNATQPVIGVVVRERTEALVDMFKRQMNVKKILLTEQELNDHIHELDFVTFFDERYVYEEYYLADLISAFYYTDVDFVQKVLKPDTAVHDYIEAYHDKYLTLFDAEAYQSDVFKLGYTLDDAEVFYNEKQVLSKNDWVSVIVPIHNNGRYLEDKCMRSLRRSSIFKHLEIIFVDDGSTDEETLHVIQRLRRKYPNIVYYRFESGSGSASRPRNKGVELATTPYITYLDPDNEAIGDGYATLYEKLQENDSVDMVIGNIIKEDNRKRSVFNYYGTIKKYNNDKPLITNTKKFMKTAGLRAQSIQALMVKADVIKNNHIKMVEGAAGQDTVFFQELMLYSKKVLGIKVPIHTYYAAVSGSVTNSISKKLFDKYYKLELERIPFLEQHQLMDAYMEQRFNLYVKGWYKPRLENVKVEEREEAIQRFLEIYQLYDKYNRPKDVELEDYIKALKKEIKH
ncbi:glycosyltransferase [Staphylococcus delphini]|uniref:glycosyltransferase n=1 Tax=Staphylococcus delphini TaxID=53344 RepID=UPI000BBCBC09|nr:glycosyltransferase [Staphylococcus delphini]PCF37080.1 glycosyl transferase [Staphylococcus delphini]PCF54019.1 glycosyl transferase [Staphylococcus delphini]PCF58905.1 glycosyl transferase [Staphylococcus delphini]PCF60153.1 glycosyl transferase [Staphylococcus delphini]